jgi:hypothetical protein
MLAEKQLLGHQQQRRNNTFMLRQLPAPAKAAPSLSIRVATPSSTGVVCSTAPSTSKGQDSSKSQLPPGVAAKANTSTGHTSDIKCQCCQGFGHMQQDCPSKWTIIATADGGYLVLLILKMKILLQLTFQVPMMVLRRFLVHLRPTTTGP